MLELEKASFRIGRAVLVEDISFAVAPGSVTAVIGPNGAGKSTSLRLLSGEVPPSTGKARLDGEALSAVGPEALARRRAVVAQRSELAFDFRVVDVVMMGRHPFNGGYPGPSDRRFAERALTSVGLEAFSQRRYLSLSGGERQRVQIARSLVQLDGEDRGQLPIRGGEAPPARYWLLDEPTSALDLRHQHVLMAQCRERAADGAGVLVVMHDLNLALRYADHVVLMCAGRVHDQGPAEAVLTSKNLATVYGVAADVVAIPPALTPQVVVRGSVAAP